jgi:hypothetical protein
MISRGIQDECLGRYRSRHVPGKWVDRAPVCGQHERCPFRTEAEFAASVRADDRIARTVQERLRLAFRDCLVEEQEPGAYGIPWMAERFDSTIRYGRNRSQKVREDLFGRTVFELEAGEPHAQAWPATLAWGKVQKLGWKPGISDDCHCLCSHKVSVRPIYMGERAVSPKNILTKRIT